MFVNDNLGVVARMDDEIFVVKKISVARNVLAVNDDQHIIHKIVFESIDCADKVFERVWKCCCAGRKYFDFNCVDEKGAIKDGFVH